MAYYGTEQPAQQQPQQYGGYQGQQQQPYQQPQQYGGYQGQQQQQPYQQQQGAYYADQSPTCGSPKAGQYEAYQQHGGGPTTSYNNNGGGDAYAYDPAVFGTSGLKPEEVAIGQPLYQNNTGISANPDAARRFIKTGYRDVWAAILFALTIVVSIGLAIHNGKDLNSDDASLTPEGRRMLKHLKTWIPAALGIGWVASMVITTAMRAFPQQFIVIANVLIIVLQVAIAIAGFASGQVWVGVLFLLCAVIQGLWLYLVRRRIPFAALLLKTSVTVITRYWGTIVTSWLCLAAGAAYYGIWMLMGAPISTDLADSSSTNGGTIAAALGLLLVLLWVTQVCANVSHVTASGVLATWYFFGEASMPDGVSTSSLKRATTTSLGSICFGSLVVAIIKLIYFLARSAARNGRNQLVACIAMCIIGIIEWLIEYFNVYAFTHVAIYGSSYIEAAKQTWRLVKECGWAAYFNDSLVWPVLTMVTFFPAAIFGIGIGLATDSAMVGIVVYLVVYVVLVLTMRPIYSGVVTQFVCVAECPDVMQTANPQYHMEVEAATQAMMSSQETDTV